MCTVSGGVTEDPQSYIPMVLGIKSATEAQGTSYFLRNTTFRNKNNFELDGEGEDCNK